MGGRGSGNHWRWGTKDTTEDYKSLDVRRWAREGFLNAGNSFGWKWTVDGEKVGSIHVQVARSNLTFVYRSRSYGEEWKDMRYNVWLDRTPCHYGGERVWFECPARGCGRRVAKLYGGEVFACRNCHRLAYPSQNESGAARAVRRADKIRDRLDWPGGILEGGGWPKPKHMHWRTYHRLSREHDHYMHRGLVGEMEFLLRIHEGLETRP